MFGINIVQHFKIRRSFDTNFMTRDSQYINLELKEKVDSLIDCYFRCIKCNQILEKPLVYSCLSTDGHFICQACEDERCCLCQEYAKAAPFPLVEQILIAMRRVRNILNEGNQNFNSLRQRNIIDVFGNTDSISITETKSVKSNFSEDAQNLLNDFQLDSTLENSLRNIDMEADPSKLPSTEIDLPIFHNGTQENALDDADTKFGTDNNIFSLKEKNKDDQALPKKDILELGSTKSLKDDDILLDKLKPSSNRKSDIIDITHIDVQENSSPHDYQKFNAKESINQKNFCLYDAQSNNIETPTKKPSQKINDISKKEKSKKSTLQSLFEKENIPMEPALHNITEIQQELNAIIEQTPFSSNRRRKSPRTFINSAEIQQSQPASVAKATPLKNKGKKRTSLLPSAEVKRRKSNLQTPVRSPLPETSRVTNSRRASRNAASKIQKQYAVSSDNDFFGFLANNESIVYTTTSGCDISLSEGTCLYVDDIDERTTTHLVCKNEIERPKRTFKFLVALCCGIPIVKESFITDCLKHGRPLETDQYIAEGCQKGEITAPKQSYENVKCGKRIFDSLSFVLVGEFYTPSKQDVASLIFAGNGALGDHGIKICDEKHQLDYPDAISSLEFFDTISNYSIDKIY
eukprot:NODE_181_length_13917_cov_0.838110.p2 type:complete len:634 gc:universal NODE_181_length_13917_cov_0.838110:4837-2936(-)